LGVGIVPAVGRQHQSQALAGSFRLAGNGLLYLAAIGLHYLAAAHFELLEHGSPRRFHFAAQIISFYLCCLRGRNLRIGSAMRF
jgi:hypothetical protein